MKKPQVFGVSRHSPRGAWPYLCSQKKIKTGGHGGLVPVGCPPLLGSEGIPLAIPLSTVGKNFYKAHKKNPQQSFRVGIFFGLKNFPGSGGSGFLIKPCAYRKIHVGDEKDELVVHPTVG